MKIARFYAENFKRLKVVEITPDGALVPITGANGSGKSSVLDAIFAALAGKKAIDPVPVRRGEESAVIELDLGKIRVTRRFRKDGESSVAVTAEDGAKYSSPQAMLDRLLGTLTFDPLEFTRMDAEARSKTLRKLVSIDVDFAKLDQENAVDFRVRTDVNRTLKELKARRAAIVLPETRPEPVDVAQLVTRLRQAGETNAERERTILKRHAVAGEVEDMLTGAQQRRAQAEKLIAEAVRLEELAAAKREWLAEQAPVSDAIDTGLLQHDIEVANAVNRSVEALRRAADEATALDRDIEQHEERARELTGYIEARAKEKLDAIAAAQMPIDGLSIDAETLAVRYLGLPFEQASGAEQLRVSVAIAMAMNPTLKVLRIKDGSLLDESNLALLAELAEEADYQVWLERVDTSGKIGVVMEDGEVRDTVPA